MDSFPNNHFSMPSLEKLASQRAMRETKMKLLFKI